MQQRSGAKFKLRRLIVTVCARAHRALGHSASTSARVNANPPDGSNPSDVRSVAVAVAVGDAVAVAIEFESN